MTARLAEVEGSLWGGPEHRAAEARTVVLVSADAGLTARLGERLTGLRWRVREASGGAQAIMLLEAQAAEAMLLDNWLPDLEVQEFARLMQTLYAEMEILWVDGGQILLKVRGPVLRIKAVNLVYLVRPIDI